MVAEVADPGFEGPSSMVRFLPDLPFSNRPGFCRLEAWLRLALSAFQDSYDAGFLRIAKLTFSRPHTAIGITQFHA